MSMAENTLEQQIIRLRSQLDELIQGYQRLKLENDSLRDQQNNLIEERAKLLEKNEQARGRVEAMITRLKAMESNT